MKSGRVDVGLLNPKSPANVGAVLRAVGCFEGDGVFFTGTRFARASRYHTEPDFVHPSQAFYAFGPEDGTLDQALIDQADAVVYVPTTGCLNLAAAVNVVLYDREAKRRTREYGDELVRGNRDTNNTVRVPRRER